MRVCTSILLLLIAVVCESSDDVRQYCIIGAGPGGMQMGYFLQSSGRDYVIFEKNSTAGSFFLHYPRHRKLISINKRYTGSTNSEFNFRHDWNSLISDNPKLKMKFYSKEYFPHADDMVRYFQDFASTLKLNIQYNTEIKRISKEQQFFELSDQNNNIYRCRVLVMSTGLWIPHVPDYPGIENIEGYESVSIDPDDYINKVVLILGRGNAAFETAANIVGSAAYIHMASRSRIKMAYQTHYVGDLRAINDELVDTYQLKSLDGQTEISDDMSTKFLIKDGKYFIVPADFKGDLTEDHGEIGVGYYFPYDAIIRCTGFNFDFSLFGTHSNPGKDSKSKGKFPDMQANYEAKHIPGMFFAGVTSHAVDYKKSAGGFIHGFRYTARALYRHLEWRYHGNRWPSVTMPVTDLLYHLIKRINEASGLYQMFNVLGDVMLFRDNDTVVYLEEVPMQALGDFKDLTGHEPDKVVLFNFEYGKSYSGPGEDVLREDRATGNPVEADTSNFLHPVLYHYDILPPQSAFENVGDMPPPSSYHHVVEDFLTDWTGRQADIIPLRRFLESIVGCDLRSFSTEECFQLTLKYGVKHIPLYCKQHYVQGLSISQGNPQISEELLGQLKQSLPELY